MNIGTKSVLFGAHQFAIHPWFVAWAWWKLFGFPWDPRLWMAFFVHDLGYLGKPDMDGPEGEMHVVLGANIMHFLFDRPRIVRHQTPNGTRPRQFSYRWLHFCLGHSRFFAKQAGIPVSKLCIADKLAIVLTPAWLYIPMVNLTGEIHEYMDKAKKKEGAKYARMSIHSDEQHEWYRNMQAYLRDWVEEHKDGRPDTWTPAQKVARDASGVWQ